MTTAPLDASWRTLARVARLLRAVGRWRIDVQGVEHVPRTGGAVLTFNHHSFLDFVMLGWAVVIHAGRPLAFLGKREVFDRRWTGWLVRRYGAIPVDRRSAASRAAALDAAVAVLRAGRLVAVAPEQTISPSFEPLPFRTGAVRMAQQAGVPLVPTVGWGTQRVATKGAPIRPRLALPVTVRFGAPLPVPPDADPAILTARLEQVTTAMLHEVQHDYPGGAPAGARWVPARLGGGAPPHAQVLGEHLRRLERWSEHPERDDRPAE
jgi:1-acyl-sn-glycerol-3-phosphate acyltransferase